MAKIGIKCGTKIKLWHIFEVSNQGCQYKCFCDWNQTCNANYQTKDCPNFILWYSLRHQKEVYMKIDLFLWCHCVWQRLHYKLFDETLDSAKLHSHKRDHFKRTWYIFRLNFWIRTPFWYVSGSMGKTFFYKPLGFKFYHIILKWLLVCLLIFLCLKEIKLS